MAARTRKLIHDEETRSRIKASQLINRLETHVLGKSMLDSSQVTAALGLLRKIIPDLANMTISGDPNNPLTTIQKIERVITSAPAEWQDAKDSNSKRLPTTH